MPDCPLFEVSPEDMGHVMSPHFFCFVTTLAKVIEVFTLPHEFRQNLPDSNQNVRIPWNSDRIHLAGASAILDFHSMEFPTEFDGIQEPLGMVSNGFQCLPLLLL